MSSKFKIFTGTNGQFYFHFKGANGEKVLSSEGYKTRQACQTGIDSVKKNAPDDEQYEKKISINGEYFFVLNAANGEPIAKSELYTSTAMRDKGIEVVKRDAPEAEVEE